MTLVALALAACGGGETAAPRENVQASTNAVTVTIADPSPGATYKDGDTLTVQISGTGSNGAALPASGLTWWVDFHHDVHTHPFVLPTVGSGGSVEIPTRGENSPNVWLRVHARATDGTGATAETTRDVFPRTASMTFATQPAGLGITLDGTPVGTPLSITGVVGELRDVDAPDQDAAGRHWRFISWGHSADAANTIATPSSNTTYTATFGDNGPSSNALPTATLTAPSTATVGQAVTVSAVANDADGSIGKVEFFDGTTLIGSDTTAPYSVTWSPASTGTHTLRARAADNIGALALSAPVLVEIAGAPVGGLAASYFANTTLSGAPAVSRPEAIDLVTTGAPVAGLPVDGWSVRWTGWIQLPTSGNYDFQLIADDGVRVSFNGAQALDKWTAGPTAYYESSGFAGVAGQRIAVTIEYADFADATFVQLNWRTPQQAATWALIPASQLVSAANAPPSVVVNAPSAATVGAPTPLSATAADADGSIASVAFYDGNTLLGTDTTAPYSVSWTPAAAGTHTITALATDNAGAATRSSAASVNVTGAPTSSGGLEATYFANETLSGTPVITRAEAVDFTWSTNTPGAGIPTDHWSARWNGSVKLPEAGNYLFELTADDGARAWINGIQIANNWVGAPNKVYTSPVIAGTAGAVLPVTIEHFDGTGNSTVRLRWKTPGSTVYWAVVPAEQLLSSAPAANAPPSVVVSAPSTATVGAAVALGANASDTDGTVASVAFYDGNALIGTDSSAPYTATWTPASGGTHSITAVATDNDGASTRSSVVSVTVGEASSPGGLQASYFANETLSGTPAITRTEVVDFTWSTNTPGAGIPADHWSVRWNGSVKLPEAGSYVFELTADDGARAWINGVQIANNWVSSGTRYYTSPAFNFTAGAVVPVTIEHFDSTGNSTVRLRWKTPGASVYWNVVPVEQLLSAGGTANAAPTVTMSPLASATVGLPVTLSATAADSDGSVQKVSFYDGNALIGTDTTSPYSVAWTPASAGTRTLSARATDNLGLEGSSNAVQVVVSNPSGGGDTTPPTVALTSPANLSSGLDGTITLSASASDNVGVTGVEFQFDGAQIGAIDTSAPYAVSVDTLRYATGQHVVRARARDAAGNLSAWATSTVQVNGAIYRNAPVGYTRNENWITGLVSGTAFTQAPDGRMFIAVQSGKLVVVKNGTKLATPFLTVPTDATGERGLIGVTLHPNFASNGWVYVYYTRINGGARNNRISRFVANGDVSTGVETVLADLPDLVAYNHNGGAMHFGPDGKLYVAVGDNAVGTRAQDLNTPFGKMLRFNEDGSIPSDNPFCTTAGKISCAVWAYGLRNPFTFAFQPGSGKMLMNDVGEATWEEINVGTAGANYGWPISEGPDRLAAGMTAPLFTYPHKAPSPLGSGPGGFFVGQAIVGGTFYPSSGPFPAEFRGKYLFADYVSRWVGVLDPADPSRPFLLANFANFPVDMLVGVDGQIYVLTRDTIIRLSYP